MPVYIRRGIESLENGTATITSLGIDASLIVLMTFLSGFFFYLVRQHIIVASREIEFDLRNDLLAHVERLSMRFFQNTPQGDIMAYATNDINAVRSFVGPAVMYSGDTITTFLFTVSFMIGISPTLTIAAIAPLPLMSIAVYFIGRKVHPLFDAVQAHYANLTSRTTEAISGIRVVRAYVREKHESRVFDELSRGYFAKNMRLIKVQGLMMPIIFTLVGMSAVILIFVGGPLVISKQLTLGGLTQFIIYLGALTWPFIALGWVMNMIQRAAASMTRLSRILETEPEIKNGDHTDRRITSIEGDITFENVTLRYRPELEPSLENVSLSIPRGSTLAIIGRTGSGKSTFASLIPRLYDVTEGAIRIDGHDIRHIPVDVLRSSIGFVTQEAFLFSDTISNNIGFGMTTATPAEVTEAAKTADIYDNVMEFPAQFETMIGERGITLSGGQKQRTSIARAVARDPKILILDDAMSAVDTATEERILRRLREIMKNRTSILISHRVSTVKEANHIIVLDRGRIIEQGTHAALLAHKGVYHDLYRKQLLEEALENA
jgi:ATP-binding cassette, subfamily B, multidrug efflux pump